MYYYIFGLYIAGLGFRVVLSSLGRFLCITSLADSQWYSDAELARTIGKYST